MPDYIYMIESRLTPAQLQVVNRVQQEAQEAELNVYLAGGAVRDLITGGPIRDLDFVFEGNPLRLVRRLSPRSPLRARVDERERSAELVLDNGVSMSLEAARNEFFPEPGKPPEVRTASILEDLGRRDFSMNAMAISLAPGSRGLFLDPTNGLADIERRELRALHNYSFLHDPTRILSLVRFSARFGFKAEPRTQEQFERALEEDYLEYCQPAGLRREMDRIVQEENVVAVLKALQARELLEVFHPALQRRKPDYDGLNKLQKYRRQADDQGYYCDASRAVFYYITRRMGHGRVKQLLRTLGMNRTETKEVLSVVGEARKLVQMLSRRKRAKPREVYSLLSPYPVGLLVFALAEYSQRKPVQTKIYNYLFKYRPLRKKLPVRELQLMGVSPGPRFNQILERFFDAQLDGKFRGRAQQLRFLRQLAGVPRPKPAPAEKPHRKEAAPPRRPAPHQAPARRLSKPRDRAVSTAKGGRSTGKRGPRRGKVRRTTGRARQTAGGKKKGQTPHRKRK